MRAPAAPFQTDLSGLSAYMLFVKTTQDRLRKEHPTETVAQIGTPLPLCRGDAWR